MQAHDVHGPPLWTRTSECFLDAVAEMVTLLVAPAVGLGCSLRVNVDHGELQRSDLQRQMGRIRGLASLWILQISYH